MLSFTRKTDYALVALSHLARAPERIHCARESACEYRIPPPVLMNILKDLCRHGMVSSVRGARGGYQLAAAPGEISLFQVVTAMEGPVRLFPCTDGGKGPADECSQLPWCPITAPARQVNERLHLFLKQVMLDEIAGADPITINSRALSPDADARHGG